MRRLAQQLQTPSWKLIVGCLLFWGSVPAASLWAQNAAELEALEEQAFQQAVAGVSPVVVRIDTVGGLEQIDGLTTAQGPTTGLIVSSDGFIISSTYNFAQKPSQILVTLNDGRQLPAEISAHDRSRMLTLLKINALSLPIPTAAVKNEIRVGQWVVAVGKTLDSDVPNISVGIVSALNRIWGKAVQTDAKISPVNYGGPLVNLEGQVVGILVPLSPQGRDQTAGVGWYASGIGFAVPLADVMAVLERLKSGKELLPGLAGITFKSNDEYGVIPTLDRVRFGSPAFAGGLQAGDQIVEVDGQKVTRLAQLRQVLGSKYAGDILSVVVKRGTETKAAKLELVGQVPTFGTPFLGILPDRGISPHPEGGVIIRHVFPKSPAAGAGLKEGQRITRVDDQPIKADGELGDAITRKQVGDKVRITVVEGAIPERMVEITLATAPGEIPLKLDPRRVEKTAEAGALPAQPQTGEHQVPADRHGIAYSAYVPKGYTPDQQHGLVVWLHPAGDSLAPTVIKAWETECEERGLILLAPQAQDPRGWKLNELVLLENLLKEIPKTYRIDPERVVLHGWDQGGQVAMMLGFSLRESVRGVVAVNAAVRGQVAENEPHLRFQLMALHNQKYPKEALAKLKSTLSEKKIPLTVEAFQGDVGNYLPPETIKSVARWIDSRDGI